MRPRLTVSRHLRITVPRVEVGFEVRIGQTIQWRIPQKFLISPSEFQSQRIIDHRLPAFLIWANDEMADLDITLETRTYVRYRS